MPLPGYAIGSDASQHTITLNHHSGMKNLCETFRVDDEVAFERYVVKVGRERRDERRDERREEEKEGLKGWSRG